MSQNLGSELSGNQNKRRVMVICVAPSILEDPTWVLPGESILLQCVARDALLSGSNTAVYFTHNSGAQ